LLVGHLVDRGILSLTDTLGDIFHGTSDWDNVIDAEIKRNIMLEDILTMTSGLREPLQGLEPKQDTLTDVLNFVFVGGPRGNFGYLPASHIISRIIYRASGETPGELAVSSGIFPSLGLSNITDYNWDIFGGIEGSAYGFRTTPRTLAKLGQLYLQEGASDGTAYPNQIISSSWVRVSTTNQLHRAKTTYNLLGLLLGEWFPVYMGYGYQWWTDIDDRSLMSYGPTFNGYFASRDFGGGQSSVVVNPTLNIVVAIITERRFNADSFIRTAIRNNDKLKIQKRSCAQKFSFDRFIVGFSESWGSSGRNFALWTQQLFEMALKHIWGGFRSYP